MSMRRSVDQLRPTHTGSLPRPPDMLETLHQLAAGHSIDLAAYESALTRHVADIVKRQVQAGIDTVSDGECSKPSFQHYVAERLAGFEPRMPEGGLPVPTGPMGLDGRDALMFPDFCRNVLEHNPFRNTVRMAPRVCVGPIRYVGHDKLRRDIENLKTAMVAAGADEGFMPASAPITALQNDYYATEEEFITAYGDAMREEYQAILDAGLILQIDFPMLVSRWDTACRTMSLADYRKWAEGRIAYLSHALRGLPEDRIRFHTCYGVNFGPRGQRSAARKHPRPDLYDPGGGLFVRGRQPAARARVAGAGAHQTARRKAPDPRRSPAFECDDRAPRDKDRKSVAEGKSGQQGAGQARG